jgi:hypothetical protein
MDTGLVNFLFVPSKNKTQLALGVADLKGP